MIDLQLLNISYFLSFNLVSTPGKDLIEKVMILKKAVERERRLLIDSGSSVLAEKLRYLLFVKLQFY